MQASDILNNDFKILNHREGDCDFFAEIFVSFNA